jgi:outer membrane protein OmpA-like peptidoglycan-associated protein
MARYYQCENPARSCELSRTGTIVTRAEWAKHCNESPACETYAEEVTPLRALLAKIKVHSAKIKWSALGLACVLLLWLLIAIFSSNPLKKAIDQSRVDLSVLNQRLRDLEAKPRTDPLRDVMAEARHVDERAERLLQEVTGSKAGGPTGEAVAQQRIAAEEMQKRLQTLKSSQPNQATKLNEILLEARRLIDDYQDRQEKVEGIRQQTVTKGRVQLTEQGEQMLIEIRSGISKAENLAKQSSQSPEDSKKLSDLFQKGEGTLAQIRSILSRPILPRPFPPEEATLRILATSDLGETFIIPLLKARSAGEPFRAENGDWYYRAGSTERVIVRRVDENPFEQLSRKACDLLFTDREPSLEEKQAFSTDFSGARLDSLATGKVVALDALTLLCHPESSRTSLGPEDLKNPLAFLGGEEGSPERLAAERFGFRVTKATKGFPADEILHEPNAIALGLYHREGANIRAKRLAWKAGPTTLELKPSPFTIATEDYRFSFRITAWNSPDAKPEAIQLVRFITSEAGQRTVFEQGYVDLGLRALAADADPRILAALAEALRLKSIKQSQAQRLSTDFRFASGDDRLDLKALGDLELVPSEVARKYANAKVVILGFTDNTGRPNINQPLSERRAEVVATELRKSGMEIESAGLGEQFPIDDNRTEEGKARNRRSEVWVIAP